MESLPLPALPADPVPPPPASRQASEDRGFADALRAAHGDDAEPDRKPASDRREPSRTHRNDHAARRHAARHHDDTRQDAAAAPVAVAATDNGAGAKSTAGTTGGDTPVVPPPADAAATPADMPVASDAAATATPDETTDKSAGPLSGAAADLAAAVRDGDQVAVTTDAASKSDGDAKKTDGASGADQPAPESARTQDKPRSETTAIPAMPAVAVQPAAAQPAAPVDGTVPAATAEIAAADVQAAAGPARPAAASAPAPVKAKADGKPDKTAATDDAADSNRDGKADAGQSIKAGQADDAADGKTSDRSAKKDDAAKDKSATPTDIGGPSKPDGGTTAAAGRPADAAPAPQPVDAASAQSTAPGTTTAPASAFMHDLRAQTQLQTPQNQPSVADAAPRLPAPPADQVAVEIGRAVQQGHDRFSLELRPGDLGRISVDLQLGSDQRVVAVIHADRHDTLQLLQKDSHTLQRALQDAGLQTDSGSLSFNLRGEGGGSQRSFADLAGNARPIALRVPVAAAEAAAQLVRPWRIGDTGIDIRV